jgi:dolichyl-phosphate beta-glucosyltransferase
VNLALRTFIVHFYILLYNTLVGKVFLSVIIPCYDEMANLQKGVLEKVKNYLNKKKFPYEVIIVDDGSRDGSATFVKEFVRENPYFQLIESDHFGKAGAVTKGMLKAQGEYVLFTDMDQATPIEELEKLLPFFDEEYDVVIGSRGMTRKGAPWTRAIMGSGMILLRTAIVGLPEIKDTQCGFKVFRHLAAQEIFSRIDKLHHGFHKVGGSNVSAGFDVELLFLATMLGYKIKEVPVRWLYVETRRVNPVLDSIEGLKGLLRIRKNAITGRYRKLN